MIEEFFLNATSWAVCCVPPRFNVIPGRKGPCHRHPSTWTRPRSPEFVASDRSLRSAMPLLVAFVAPFEGNAGSPIFIHHGRSVTHLETVKRRGNSYWRKLKTSLGAKHETQREVGMRRRMHGFVKTKSVFNLFTAIGKVVPWLLFAHGTLAW